MGFQLSARSERNLVDVHPDLVRVIRAAAAICPFEFVVIEGRRSLARQALLCRTGLSRIKNPVEGRHVSGHAVDLAVVQEGRAVWDRASYGLLAAIVDEAVNDLALADGTAPIPIRWGGRDFGPKFYDGPHFELPRDKYPADVPTLPASPTDTVVA